MAQHAPDLAKDGGNILEREQFERETGECRIERLLFVGEARASPTFKATRVVSSLAAIFLVATASIPGEISMPQT